MDYIVDVEGRRLISSFTSTRTTTPESVVFGDEPDISVRLVESNPSADAFPWRYVDLTGHSIRVAIGNPGGDPSTGTFTLTFDGDTTTDLAAGSTAAQVDTALNALTSITSAGGVTVTSAAAGQYQIAFDSVGARNLITANTDALYPASSAYIYEATAGDASTKEVQVANIEVDNAAYVELTTDIAAPAATVTTVREGVTDTTSELQRIEISGDPYLGTFAITINGNTSDAISIDATLDELTTAIEGITDIGAGNVVVTGSITDFTIQFAASLGNVAEATVDVANLTGAIGKTGTIDFNTNQFLELLNGSAQVSATLEIVKFKTTGSKSSTVLQAPITCREDVIADTPVSTTPFPAYAAASHQHVVADITDIASSDITLNTDSNLAGNAWFLDDDTMAANDAQKVASQQSVKAYVDAQISGLGNAMEFKGSYDATGDPTDGGIGDMYVVTVGGTGAASFWSTSLESGDVIIQENDPATTEADWVVVSRDFNGDPLIELVEDTTPQLGGMLDVNGNALGDGTLELLKFTETGSAVNEITIANAATAGDPTISATGDDANIGLSLQGKGTGDITLGNYVFDGDGAATASEDNYVMTYDDASGTVRLEAAAGGSPEGTAVLSTGEVGGTKFLREDGDGTCSWQAVPSGDIVNDTTPQLGGSLDVNGQKIVSVSNGNIDIEPNGTGNVLLGNFTFDADQTVGAGQDNYVLTYDNAAGTIGLEAAAGGGSGDFLADGSVPMTGELDLGANSIGGTLQSITPLGNLPNPTTIDWGAGNAAAMTFDPANETFIFTAPTKPGWLLLKLTQDATGGRTVTWPGTVKWPGGTAPTLSTGANAVDIIRFYFDGTNYYGTYDLNFS